MSVVRLIGGKYAAWNVYGDTDKLPESGWYDCAEADLSIMQETGEGGDRTHYSWKQGKRLRINMDRITAVEQRDREWYLEPYRPAPTRRWWRRLFDL